MDFLTSGFNLLLIILGFGVLIFFHELGHFLAAKWAGIRTEAFAIGMGPVLLAWRKGIGFCVGSSHARYEQRIRERLARSSDRAAGSEAASGPSRTPTTQDVSRAEAALGIGETEYSLRLLPIGGFVKMLGQDDTNPNNVSNDPRSYNRCPVGKRMIVVSAGVVMNLILAAVLFVVAFMVGVRFEDAVVGRVASGLPAETTAAVNATALAVREPGLKPGDRVLQIDDRPARTFADIQIATAMAKPGQTLVFLVQRPGLSEPLEFQLEPKKDAGTGLLGIGIAPGASAQLLSRAGHPQIVEQFRRTGLEEAGVEFGMRLLRVGDRPVSSYEELRRIVESSGGEPVTTIWSRVDADGRSTGAEVRATLEPTPVYSVYHQREATADEGLLGLSRLVRVSRVPEGSPNARRLRAGDVLLKVDRLWYPRRSQLYAILAAHKGRDLDVTVLRAGEQVVVPCQVTRKGMLQIEIDAADDVMLTADPINTFARARADDPSKIEDLATPIKPHNLWGGTEILAVQGQPVSTWRELRRRLQAATASAAARGAGATVRLSIAHPTPGHEREELALELSDAEVQELARLSWAPAVPSFLFEPIYTTLSSEGNPVRAISMGLEETYQIVVMTYLTIDRLIRGSVGVEQLRGPVGIVHIGTKVADRGLMYLIFFLAMISVNLAVINFLPLPIVDGGLFLFLVYEKLKGKPPSLAFQNAAIVVGLFIIGTAIVVTFYNDVMRLLS